CSHRLISYFFLLLILPPPRSPLFPYTTLFRSLVCTALMLAATPSAKAQFVVTDPTNLASGILNSANEIVQTSSTVSNVVKNFNEDRKEHTSELQSRENLVCRLLLEKKKTKKIT